MRPYNGFGPLLEQHDRLAYTEIWNATKTHVVRRGADFKRNGLGGYYKALCGRILHPRRTRDFALHELCDGCKKGLLQIIEERASERVEPTPVHSAEYGGIPD